MCELKVESCRLSKNIPVIPIESSSNYSETCLGERFLIYDIVATSRLLKKSNTKLFSVEKRGKQQFSICSNSQKYCGKKAVCIKQETNNSRHCMLVYFINDFIL